MIKNQMYLARGVKPSRCAVSADIKTTAEAPIINKKLHIYKLRGLNGRLVGSF